MNKKMNKINKWLFMMILMGSAYAPNGENEQIDTEGNGQLMNIEQSEEQSEKQIQSIIQENVKQGKKLRFSGSPHDIDAINMAHDNHALSQKYLTLIKEIENRSLSEEQIQSEISKLEEDIASDEMNLPEKYDAFNKLYYAVEDHKNMTKLMRDKNITYRFTYLDDIAEFSNDKLQMQKEALNAIKEAYQNRLAYDDAINQLDKLNQDKMNLEQRVEANDGKLNSNQVRTLANANEAQAQRNRNTNRQDTFVKSRLQQQIAGVEAKMKELKDNQSQITNTYESQIKALEATHQQEVENIKEEHGKTVNQLNNQIKKNEMDIEDLTNKLQNLQSTHDSLQSTHDSLQSEHNTLKDTHANTIQQHNNEKQALKQRIQDLEIENKQLRQKAEQIEQMEIESNSLSSIHSLDSSQITTKDSRSQMSQDDLGDLTQNMKFLSMQGPKTNFTDQKVQNVLDSSNIESKTGLLDEIEKEINNQIDSYRKARDKAGQAGSVNKMKDSVDLINQYVQQRGSILKNLQGVLKSRTDADSQNLLQNIQNRMKNNSTITTEFNDIQEALNRADQSKTARIPEAKTNISEAPFGFKTGNLSETFSHQGQKLTEFQGKKNIQKNLLNKLQESPKGVINQNLSKTTNINKNIFSKPPNSLFHSQNSQNYTTEALQKAFDQQHSQSKEFDQQLQEKNKMQNNQMQNNQIEIEKL